ncbi:MAG: hypothetical protein AAF696_29345, partial [Bacteroidota bacterium]
MRVSCCIKSAIFLLTLLIFLLPHTLSQELEELKVKGKFYNRSLISSLIHFEIDYKLKFEYQREDLEDISLNLSFGNKYLPEAMRLLLSGTGLDFE